MSEKSDWDKGYDQAMMRAYGERKALKARIAELEAAQHWIPVEERLPEKHECVLLLMKSKRYGVGVGIGHRLSSERHGWMVTYLPMPYDEITHWMPLPNPPEVKL